MKRTIQTRRTGWTRRAWCRGFCLAVVATLFWSAAAQAQESGGTATDADDLLFIDVQEVLVGSSAMLDIRRQVNDQITAIRSDAQEEEVALIEEEKQIKARADSLSEEQTQAEYRKLDERLTTVRAELSQRLQSVQNGAFEAQREVENQLARIFAEMRVDKGAALLVNPQGILAAADGYVIPDEQDITDEVLLLLDERLPAVIVMPRVIPPAPLVSAPALGAAEVGENSEGDTEGEAQ